MKTFFKVLINSIAFVIGFLIAVYIPDELIYYTGLAAVGMVCVDIIRGNSIVNYIAKKIRKE